MQRIEITCFSDRHFWHVGHDKATFGYLLAGLPYQALVPPLSIGFVSVIGVVMIAPISSYIAPLGARLAHALPRRRLEIGFGLFLLAVSARFVVSLIV